MPTVADLQSQLDRLDAENAALRREVDSLRALGGASDEDRSRERFFETIIDNLYDGVAVVDEEGVIRYESPSVERISGFPITEVVGQNFFDFLHPDEHARVTELFADHLTVPGEWRGAELRFRHADGGWIDLEARAVNLVGVPAINGIVAIYRDVTEQRLAESRLATLSAEVPGILYQLRTPPDSSRFTIPFISDGVRRIFGIDPREVRENPLTLVNLMHTEDRAKYVEIAGDATSRGEAFQLDVRCIDVNEEVRWFRIGAVPSSTDDEGQLLYNGIAIDVTSEKSTWRRLQELTIQQEEKVFERTAELRRALDALRDEAARRDRVEAENRRLESQIDEAILLSTATEMMTGVAHDLHQPLTAIGNYAGGCLIRLEKGTLDDSETVRVLNEMRDASLRAAEVVRRARDFVHTRTFDRRPQSINDVCDTALKLGEFGLRERGVELRLEYGDDLPLVFADRIPIAQVVLNLLQNAAEALQSQPAEHRHIVLSTELADPAHVRVSVEDDGTGIPEDEYDKIFDRFVSSKEDGLGLGLATCRSIVKLHDGVIRVEPSPLGGCAFRFTLPVVVTTDDSETDDRVPHEATEPVAP